MVEYNRYLQREMPGLVKASLEQVAGQQTQHIGPTVFKLLPRIIQEDLERAFQAYKQTRSINSVLPASPIPETVASAAHPTLGAQEEPGSHQPDVSNNFNFSFQTPTNQDDNVDFDAIGTSVWRQFEDRERNESGAGSAC